MAKKKLSRSKLVKKLDDIFSLYIRLRHAKNEIVECFTCGKKAHYKDNMQCGHFQSRKHYSTRWNTINCQVQCKSCNVYRFGEQFIFGNKIDAIYGVGTADELHIKSKKIVKLTSNELILMINQYKDLVNDLK
tara:strand:- start:1326 stop:1724 length:399 start_codon:yes stop_codon:yes gene_type:complete